MGNTDNIMLKTPRFRSKRGLSPSVRKFGRVFVCRFALRTLAANCHSESATADEESPSRAQSVDEEQILGFAQDDTGCDAIKNHTTSRNTLPYLRTRVLRVDFGERPARPQSSERKSRRANCSIQARSDAMFRLRTGSASRLVAPTTSCREHRNSVRICDLY